ncbi:ankyrin repeat-containing protein ITN1 isoform X3 [Vitis vinifera]|uniref:ankyrin repeat-containing protein ITN1 isoform X3 n=1 Tax=Vitis vinifera TaxID=29760 RepID=UPI0008FEB0E7|nr:ankyrin repeat-containing protein ITN1 isoform X3 [Vitis vinifera]|eukprot:XP_019073567.1 PREDICTED: ankyrin repeat-containing protein ITN1 isoform X3 [Vitis vinifera]
MALRMEDPELEGIKTKLFERAMEGRWKEVIEIYKNNTMAHRAKITVLEDTALHIAVLEGKEAEVEKMVYQIGEDARMIKNKMGNTPLHLAASIGNVSMCKCIANRNARLVGARNKKNETPLFLAALQGKKDAFLCLLEICRDQALEFCRRDDGETILHCAITGEYFDLAFTIILEFPKLANYVNEQGLSPLHLLANKPTAFRSGTHLSWIDKIIYYCVFIPELKHHKEMHGEKKDSYCLGNTQTCVDFFLNMRNTTEGPAENAPKSGEHTDAENPKEGQAGPQHQGKKTKKTEKVDKKETPILLAAKNGIAEMVREILDRFPVAIQDMNSEHKNMVLLAVENRQPHVYELLLNRKIQKDTVFRIVDKDGNSALHLAAMLRDNLPWHIPGAALQMQWEIKWFDYVKNSMPIHFFPHYNANNQTPKEVFNESHKELVEKGGKWLKATSDSCSVVSALIATVAFATSATVPGGIKEDSGKPILERQPAFRIFAISSLVALCFSVTSVVMFLAILTSRYQVKDFRRDLPRKLLLGLSSLFVSIAAILVSFCAGHFFVLKDELKYAAFPVYAVTCLPVTFFAIAQFPLYLDLVWATFKKVPKRGSRDDT